MRTRLSPQSAVIAGFMLSSLAVFLNGCGSASTPTVPPTPGTTNVVVLLTSTANERLVFFNLAVANISLTDSSGKSVTLFDNPNATAPAIHPTEYVHLSGVSEPLVTTAIPQGVYPTASIKVGYCSFTDVWVSSSGGLNEDTYAQGLCAQGTGTTTVNLPSPITVSGQTMALSVNLQIPQSYTLNGTGTTASYTISPVFNLTPIHLSSNPTNEANGKITGINAQITSINAASNGFVAQMSDGVSLNINTNGTAAYQGISGFSSLTVGMVVDLDVAIQPDTSLLATRIEVNDSAAAEASIGALYAPGSQTGQFVSLPTEQLGCAISALSFCSNAYQFDGNTVFGFSNQLSNVQNLPFTPSFDSSSKFLGQNFSSLSSGIVNAQSFATVRTATLMPQTINGTVMAVSSQAGFSIYTVSIASYALVPTLQGYVGPINRLNSPTTVIVYVDTNTQFLSSTALNTGAMLRFRGLLLNDNGTLRMDCVQILDGVPE
jgi:Domain of unknown function (DUF5666)